MISKDKLKHMEITNTLRQKIWNFMRRNRIFVVSDVMAITGANYKYLKEMISTFERGGYIQVLKDGKAFSSMQLKLIRYTGVKAPAYHKDLNIIYDYNTDEEIDVSKVLIVEKILDSLNAELVTKQEIARNVEKTLSSLKNQYADLIADGVISRTDPVEYNELKEMFFKVDIEKVKEKKKQYEEERKSRLLEKKNQRKTISKPPQSLIKILDSMMSEDKVTMRDLDRKACVSLKTSENYWERLLKRGVVKKIEPVERSPRGGIFYKVYPKKIEKLKEKLEKGEKL